MYEQVKSQIDSNCIYWSYCENGMENGMECSPAAIFNHVVCDIIVTLHVVLNFRKTLAYSLSVNSFFKYTLYSIKLLLSIYLQQ